jgi:hypothetical protein
MVLDWWHLAVRFEHAMRAARGLGAGAGAADMPLAERAVRAVERAKWRLWHVWTAPGAQGVRRDLAFGTSAVMCPALIAANDRWPRWVSPNKFQTRARP